MAVLRAKMSSFMPTLFVLFNFLVAFVLISAERSIKREASSLSGAEHLEPNDFLKLLSSLWQTDQSGYQHVWPELRFGWRVVIGTLIGFFGAAFGSVGGVGGGGIFVPMLTLIIGFDQKSATALSKCMITGAAVSTLYHNLGLKHPTLDLPVIEYDLVLLIQPVLILGISMGVTFNVIFPDWVITILLIILFLGTSTKSFFLGLSTWKKETTLKKEAAKRLEGISGAGAGEYNPLPGGPSNIPKKGSLDNFLRNLKWKELGLLFFVWVAYLALQIAKSYTTTCSTAFWVFNLLQIPVSAVVFLYQAIGLYTGRRRISCKGDEDMNWDVKRLLMFCACGMVAGIVGGLLGIGGGFVMGPLFLEMGIPPQVSSATATFGMSFSSSMSVVEYYLLNRFPVPYALYLILVAIVAAFLGQYIITKLIVVSGRQSLIIFVLSFTIFISAISLGGVGITNMIGKIERGEYMGFENLCKYGA
ncbi:hypothetical protein Tsubulata_017452 [Turnera subulata]|uniref:Sulfite exporter TauE/SafE family protein 3-like n=1 Tax=Turnera subulata TaxID=218843 RepID=A0A9Q0G4I8_9ROSI|nr:hypothetical protein Tsubulata_017452 [Turnera subulata]